MINVLTSYFYNPERDPEYKFCLHQNLKNPSIAKVIAFCEDPLDIVHNKLWKVEHTRPTYQDFFNFTENFLEDVNVITNSDIFFNNTIELAERVTSNECYAITRHEYRKGKPVEFMAAHGKTVSPAWSQDVWIFRGKARIRDCDTVMAENLGNGAYDTIRFYMGIGGCDNVIARRIQQAGYQLKNPYQQIICMHKHANESRPIYSHRMTGNRTRWGGLLKVNPTQI